MFAQTSHSTVENYMFESYEKMLGKEMADLCNGLHTGHKCMNLL